VLELQAKAECKYEASKPILDSCIWVEFVGNIWLRREFGDSILRLEKGDSGRRMKQILIIG
jgi:hypothetical protein